MYFMSTLDCGTGQPPYGPDGGAWVCGSLVFCAGGAGGRNNLSKYGCGFLEVKRKGVFVVSR